MTSGLMIMAVDEDGTPEGVIWRNVDMSFVVEDVVIIFPVQEAGPEGSGDILQG